MNVEDEIQVCVELLGGERVSKTFGESPSFQDADFIFKDYGIISELKSLEEDKINDDLNIEKVSKLYLKELEANKAPVIAFGTVNMSTKGFSEGFTRSVIDIYKKPIQGAIKKANRQIRETKQAFEQPKFQGLLIVANNNHSALDPWHANFILEELLSKPDYSSVNSAVYLTAGQASIHPETGEEYSVWIVKHRNGLSQVSDDFLEGLRQAWFTHFTKIKGEESHFELSANKDMLAILENKKTE
ncbi:hypothetical protein [uncultured Psychrosphaera sp.]|uniref:hypothetical protein n=1 Tax=uncultured Psychrosphaera sp. TaxID=1403522 RepID=UPI00262600F0|nr:hypothetical protein [uncultured Psychrosphaera sp.]